MRNVWTNFQAKEKDLNLKGGTEKSLMEQVLWGNRGPGVKNREGWEEAKFEQEEKQPFFQEKKLGRNEMPSEEQLPNGLL